MKTKLTKSIVLGGLMTAVWSIGTPAVAQTWCFPITSVLNNNDPTFTFSINPNCTQQNTNTTCVTYYNWNFGDGNVQTTTQPTVAHTYTANGTYNVYATLVDSCQVGPGNTYSTSSLIQVNVNNATNPPSNFSCNLSLNITPDSTAGPGHYAYNYTYSPANATPVSYTWTIWSNPPASSNAANPSFTLSPGTYDLCLAVTLSNGTQTCWAVSCYYGTYTGDANNNVYLYKVGTFTGIKEVNGSSPTVQIYPNPANDVLNVKISDKENVVMLREISGRVLKKISGGSDIQIPLSDIKAGTYLLEVQNEKGRTTKLFMKE